MSSESPDLWRLIGQATREPICVFDTEFRLIGFNQAHNDEFFRVNGFHTRIGDVFPDLFIEKQGRVMRSLMARALTGEAFTVVEEFGKPELGTPQWEISYAPLRHADGTIFGAFHLARDLARNPLGTTAQLSMVDARRSLDDAALRRIVIQLDDQLRDVVDPDTIAGLCARVVGETMQSGSAGFGLMRADGDTMDIVRDWRTDGTLRLVGSHRLSDYGDCLAALRHGDDFVVSDVETDQRHHLDASACRAIGARSLVVVPVLEGGRHVATFIVACPGVRNWSPSELAFIRNVAERARLSIERRQAQQRLEDQLRQAQKMEAVGQLTGGLAHDFNNLLGGITGALDLMQRRIALGQYSAETQNRYITVARGAATRAAALTHRLLAFARRQPLDARPVDINVRIGDMTELVQRTVGPTIDLQAVAAIGLWTVKVDANQLENAVLNLAINSRDAMPDGGTITIRTANEFLHAHAAGERGLAPGQYVSVSVTDTGTGMTSETLSHAFEPFFTTKPLGQGTGLGLSMVYGFARQSGGQARIESAPGRGTTVSLCFPRHVGPGDAIDVPTQETYPTRRRIGTALLVEDESSMRLLMSEVLGEQGLDVLEAASSTAGLKILRSDARIDLVVTDIGLPGGMNGRQMIEAARAFRTDMKVLYVTGYAENAIIGDGLLTPDDQLLTKPFALNTFAARVSAMTGGA